MNFIHNDMKTGVLIYEKTCFFVEKYVLEDENRANKKKNNVSLM